MWVLYWIIFIKPHVYVHLEIYSKPLHMANLVYDFEEAIEEKAD